MQEGKRNSVIIWQFFFTKAKWRFVEREFTIESNVANYVTFFKVLLNRLNSFLCMGAN